ncbi:MAG: pyridoxamine 5'-phosphate oxidase family protein [Leptolyngbyaceae cyanobacterium CSU_1_4]|nr:pyridoxamine 5'-phosphate oxidase family protein [Leptolyngbyaceae cyanobacterium CSU_1_4]
MAKVFDHITPELQQFIAQQHLFFVATAPLSETGHVNVSPKGLDCFRVLSPNRIAYLDLTGSGNETSAHLQENGRITLMFCAFQGAPSILRLYGNGKTLLPADGEWESLRAKFPDLPGVRQIITADIDRVQTSCGHGVPLYEHQESRSQLVAWAEKKGEAGLAAYHQQKNRISIDGLWSAIARSTTE